MGPEISFFEYVCPDPSNTSHAVRGDVVGPAIAEQDKIRYLSLTQELVEEHRPLGEPAAETRRRVRPIANVATTEIDPVNWVSTASERMTEFPKCRARRTLQK